MRIIGENDEQEFSAARARGKMDSKAAPSPEFVSLKWEMWQGEWHIVRHRWCARARVCRCATTSRTFNQARCGTEDPPHTYFPSPLPPPLLTICGSRHALVADRSLLRLLFCTIFLDYRCFAMNVESTFFTNVIRVSRQENAEWFIRLIPISASKVLYQITVTRETMKHTRIHTHLHAGNHFSRSSIGMDKTESMWPACKPESRSSRNLWNNET